MLNYTVDSNILSGFLWWSHTFLQRGEKHPVVRQHTSVWNAAVQTKCNDKLGIPKILGILTIIINPLQNSGVGFFQSIWMMGQIFLNFFIFFRQTKGKYLKRKERHWTTCVSRTKAQRGRVECGRPGWIRNGGGRLANGASALPLVKPCHHPCWSAFWPVRWPSRLHCWHSAC